jgi:hypothetical protein
MSLDAVWPDAPAQQTNAAIEPIRIGRILIGIFLRNVFIVRQEKAGIIADKAGA